MKDTFFKDMIETLKGIRAELQLEIEKFQFDLERIDAGILALRGGISYEDSEQSQACSLSRQRKTRNKKPICDDEIRVLQVTEEFARRNLPSTARVIRERMGQLWSGYSCQPAWKISYWILRLRHHKLLMMSVARGPKSEYCLTSSGRKRLDASSLVGRRRQSSKNGVLAPWLTDILEALQTVQDRPGIPTIPYVHSQHDDVSGCTSDQERIRQGINSLKRNGYVGSTEQYHEGFRVYKVRPKGENYLKNKKGEDAAEKEFKENWGNNGQHKTERLRLVLNGK